MTAPPANSRLSAGLRTIVIGLLIVVLGAILLVPYNWVRGDVTDLQHRSLQTARELGGIEQQLQAIQRQLDDIQCDTRNIRSHITAILTDIRPSEELRNANPG